MLRNNTASDDHQLIDLVYLAEGEGEQTAAERPGALLPPPHDPGRQAARRLRHRPQDHKPQVPRTSLASPKSTHHHPVHDLASS